MSIPISKNLIEPIIKSNVYYVENIEEFEKIELDINETRLCFDNNKQCFYIKERDKHGEYSSVKVYFYEDFSQRLQRLEKDEFIHKCEKVGFDSLKVEIACMFFLENKKPQEVWLWLLENNKKNCEWDTIKRLKYRMKLKLFPELIKHKVDKKSSL